MPYETREQATSVAPGQPGGDPGSCSDRSDHNGWAGPKRDNVPRFQSRNQAEQEYSEPPDTASSVGRNLVAEDAIVELRNLFQEQRQRDAFEKDDQKGTREDAARQKASQEISGAFRDRTFTSSYSLGQNFLEYIVRFEAVCESAAVALEFKASLIHYMPSDSQVPPSQQNRDSTPRKARVIVQQLFFVRKVKETLRASIPSGVDEFYAPGEVVLIFHEKEKRLMEPFSVHYSAEHFITAVHDNGQLVTCGTLQRHFIRFHAAYER
jgi:hypothetical protein